MALVDVKDLEPVSRRVIETYMSLYPDTEATPDTLVLRDGTGSIAVNSLTILSEPSDVVDGELVLRDKHNRLVFCKSKKDARKAMGIPTVFITDTEPPEPNTGDFWIGGE